MKLNTGKIWRLIVNNKADAIVVMAVLVLIYLGHLGMYPLFNPDEGRYAEIPREMLATGNFITPHLNGVEYFEKPALQYWFSAIMLHIFGQHEFSVRLFPALTALGGLYMVKALGTSMFDRKTGLLAMVITGTSFLYLIIGSLNILDMAVAVFITWSMVAFYRFRQTSQRKYLYWCYVAMALGVLTKGLIGIVLVVGIIWFYLIVTRQWKWLLKTISPIGILLFLAITVPWFYLVCRDNSDFFYFFFIHEHFLRYLTKVHQRYEPWWFFIPCLLIGIFPWLGFLFARPRRLWQGLTVSKHSRDYWYLVLWSGLILLFFSLSDSKLVPYIVPCIPPLSIILARIMLTGERLGVATLINAIVATLLAAGLVVTGYKRADGINLLVAAIPFIVITLIGTWWGVLSWYKQRNAEALIGIYVVMALLYSFATWPIINYVASTRTGKPIAAVVNEWKTPDTTVVMYRDYVQDVPFYTNSRILLYQYVGELEFGSKHPSGEGWFIQEPQQLVALWDSAKPLILIVPRKEWDNARETLKLPEASANQIVIGKYIVVKHH